MSFMAPKISLPAAPTATTKPEAAPVFAQQQAQGQAPKATPSTPNPTFLGTGGGGVTPSFANQGYKTLLGQ